MVYTGQPSPAYIHFCSGQLPILELDRTIRRLVRVRCGHMAHAAPLPHLGGWSVEWAAVDV